ncbi:MFS transporter [Phytoactinopolyspora alkaliphila]|uniref:MFS transporter n=1 Tax=Phytoactinopolyspora alkaliphila TaxID=1783498 RepID=A0A6N9YJI4_9ACTN|nr:MFS transporter [Phytoactinopolyspora alkaliphila]NED95153.1 MFS transporter [Phytoactinopolyspora alkaliphila]
MFGVRIAGQFGDGVLQVALASYVFFSPERQTGAAATAAAFAVLLLPYSVIGPFAGVLLDRWQRRQVLLFTNLCRAALSLAMVWQVTDGNVGPPFFITVLAMLSLNRFVLAGLSASVPRVVERDELVMANSVAPTSGAVAMIAGVGAGYLTQRWLFGSDAEESAEGPIVLLATLLYLVAALLSLRIGRTTLGPGGDDGEGSGDGGVERIPVTLAARQVVDGMAEGARHIAARKPALWALTAMASTRFFYGLTLIAAILLSRNYFHDPADVDAGLGTLAMLLGISGAGFMVAALLTPVATRQMRKETWAALLLAAAAVVVLVPGTLFTVPAMAVVAGVLGLATQGMKIVVDTVVHESVDDEYRGRVFSFYDVAFNASFVLAAGAAALLLPATGQSYLILVVIATGFAATAVGYHVGVHRRAAERMS